MSFVFRAQYKLSCFLPAIEGPPTKIKIWSPASKQIVEIKTLSQMQWISGPITQFDPNVFLLTYLRLVTASSTRYSAALVFSFNGKLN